MKVRCWTLTLNNYTEEEHKNLLEEAEKCTYAVIGKEVGDKGTPHLQAYFRFPNARHLDAIKKLSPRAHWEAAKGDDHQNRVYCTKDGDFVEFGTISKAGKRSDIVQVRELLAERKSMREIVQVATSYQSIRTAECILKYNEKVRDWIPEIFWFYGPTGTGKTKKAYEMCKDPWISNKDLKWWDGYDAHEDVIFDDFRGDFCTFHELLRILDRYPYRVMVKGGSRQLLAKRIFITSPYRPEEVYSTREDIGQLIRRISVVTEFGPEVEGNTIPRPVPDEKK